MKPVVIPTAVPSVGRADGRTFKSPLRYPGGKSRAVKQILPFLPKEPGILVSPFIGGGSVELAAAALGWQVHGYDAFQPLVHFWQEVLTEPEVLAEVVEQYLPLSRETFYRLQRSQFPTSLGEAARFFVLNRASFSGSTCSGGMSPGHGRFTRSCIERLRGFRTPNVWVEHADFHQSIPQHGDAFLWLDPPYSSAKRLYGRRGDLHDGFDHKGLRDLLGSRGGWLLSYDDCPEVRWLYQGYQIVELRWKYGMSTNKASREILIIGDNS
ncbi:DNA adenine methylase [bacterium]|nr:DNA adenine methylase [bacterium]